MYPLWGRMSQECLGSLIRDTVLFFRIHPCPLKVFQYFFIFLLYRLFLLSWYQVKLIVLCCFWQTHDREYGKMSVILVQSLELWELLDLKKLKKLPILSPQMYMVDLEVNSLAVQWKMNLACILLKPLWKNTNGIFCTAWHYLLSLPSAV